MTPILIALFTTFVSLVGLLISKESKTSEFRQNWIDELRKDIAEYIAMSAAHAFHYMHSWSEINDIENRAAEAGDDYYTADGRRAKVNEFFAQESYKVDNLHSRIILRLNPDEHGQLLSAFQSSYTTYISFLRADAEKRRQELNTQLGIFNRQVRDISVVMLKTEWVRVKDGEPYFNKAKKLAGTIVIILIILLAISVIGSFIHPSPAPQQVPPQPQKQATPDHPITQEKAGHR